MLHNMTEKKPGADDRRTVTKQRTSSNDSAPKENDNSSEESSSESDEASKLDRKSPPQVQSHKPKKIRHISYSKFVGCFIFCIVAMIATYCICYPNNKNNSASELPILTNNLYSLDKDFPQQPLSLWTAIVSGIKDLYTREPQQPCVILWFGEVETKETAECLVHEVAHKVIRNMHNDNIKPALVESANIHSNDYGEVLQDLRSKVASQKVLIIQNLQDMEGSVAQSLHALCDRYNPAVSEALIMFTLYGKPTSGNAAAVAQQLLITKWQTHVPSDKLPALITRITSRVISVLPESHLPEKCFKLKNNLNNREL